MSKRNSNNWQFWFLLIVSVILILMMSSSAQAKDNKLNEKVEQTFEIIETYCPENEVFKIIVVRDNKKGGEYLILKHNRGNWASITPRNVYSLSGRLMTA